MAKATSGIYGNAGFMETTPKKTRQGRGKHTKYTSTSRNKAKKVYRGQGN